MQPIEIVSAKEMLQKTEEFQKHRDNLKENHESSIRPLVVEEIKVFIERWAKSGYKYTIFGFPGTTAAERKLFEDAGYETIYHKNEQKCDFRWSK